MLYKRIFSVLGHITCTEVRVLRVQGCCQTTNWLKCHFFFATVMLIAHWNDIGQNSNFIVRVVALIHDMFVLRYMRPNVSPISTPNYTAATSVNVRRCVFYNKVFPPCVVVLCGSILLATNYVIPAFYFRDSKTHFFLSYEAIYTRTMYLVIA